MCCSSQKKCDSVSLSHPFQATRRIGLSKRSVTFSIDRLAGHIVLPQKMFPAGDRCLSKTIDSVASVLNGRQRQGGIMGDNAHYATMESDWSLPGSTR